jgi:uncharacterized protein YqeY
MILRDRLKADLMKAMKARETNTVTILRTLLGAIDNAEAVEVVEPSMPIAPVIGQSNEVPRKVLTEADILAILQCEADEQAQAVAEYERLGQQAEADRLRAGLEVITQYL